MNYSKYIQGGAWAMAALLVTASCSRTEDPVYEQTPTQRIEQTLQTAQSALIQPSNGWIMRIYPSADRKWGGYTVLVKFAEDGSLVSAGELFDKDKTYSSYYKINNSNLPVLTFDTFNKPIHLFSLPNLNYIIAEDKQERGTDSRLGIFSGASTNKGLDGDYAYRIISASASRVELQGVRTATRIILEPAPETAWSEQLAAIQTASTTFAMPRVKLTIGETTYSGRMNVDTRQLRFTDASGNVVLSTAFCYTGTGIRLYEAITLGGVSIEEFISVGDNTNVRLQTADGKATLEPSAIPISELLAYNQEMWEIFLGGSLSGELSGRFLNAVDNFNTARGSKYTVLNLDLGSSTVEGYTDFGLYAVLMDLDNYNMAFAYLPLTITATGETEVKIVFDPARIKEEQKDFIESSLATMLAAGFSGIGKVADTDGTVYYDETISERTFRIETDSKTNPTWIKLIDQSDSNSWIKIKRATIVGG